MVGYHLDHQLNIYLIYLMDLKIVIDSVHKLKKQSNQTYAEPLINY